MTPQPKRYMDVVAWLRQEFKHRSGGASLTAGEAYMLLAGGAVMSDSHPIRERYIDADLRPTLRLKPREESS